jgi:5-hydroxyisourate hydrolase
MSTATTVSTHVLDTSLGTPAAGLSVTLDRIGADGEATRISSHLTNKDGRVTALAPDDRRLPGGSYRLSFDVASYFAQTLRKGFYSEICIAFEIGDEPQHYHVPLLLSPFGYSTYRGS